MTRRFLLVVTMLMGVVFATAPLASAQTDVDIEQVSETVLSADTDALLTGLETPMGDDALPEGFSEATFAAPDAAATSVCPMPFEGIEGTIGSVNYAVEYDPASMASPEADDTNATAEASPDAGISSGSAGFSCLYYVMFEDEFSSSDLEEFKAGAEEGSNQDAEGGTASVEDITFGDTDALLLTFTTEGEEDLTVVQMVAVPAGNVLVMSIAAYSGPDFDVNTVQTDAEDLALAGIDHLGVVAEDAQ